MMLWKTFFSDMATLRWLRSLPRSDQARPNR
jgi:hypothetical protein